MVVSDYVHTVAHGMLQTHANGHLAGGRDRQTLQLIKHANDPVQRSANRFAGEANRDAEAMQAITEIQARIPTIPEPEPEPTGAEEGVPPATMKRSER